ncbi:MAG: hypothetical protein RLZZ319_772 [Actinomycetota bacterium]
MSDSLTPMPSRRAQREAREAAERAQFVTPTPFVDAPVAAPVVTSTELPSRRSLRRAAPEVVPTITPETYGGSAPDWVPTAPTVGTSNIAVTTLHVESFPTGEIAGPIDSTGEIILTGPIEVPPFPVERVPSGPIDASVEGHQPGIPRRATEALSIIGRSAPIDERRRIPSVGQGISAGVAAFLGLLVISLIAVAIVTQLI